MPTTRSLRAGGYDDQKLGIGEKFCHVCGERVRGFCQKDTPDAKGVRQGVTLGYRHTRCMPPEAAIGGTSRKTFLGVGR